MHSESLFCGIAPRTYRAIFGEMHPGPAEAPRDG